MGTAVETLDTTSREVVVRSTGALVLAQGSLEGDQLRVIVGSQVLCHAERVDTHTRQTVKKNQAEGVLGAALGGIGAAVVGGAALALAPGMSNVTGVDDNGEETASPQQTAYALGGLSAAGGAVWLGHTLSVSVRAADKPIGGTRQEQETVVLGPDAVCETNTTVTGSLAFRIDDAPPFATVPSSGTVDLDLRALASTPDLAAACRDDQHLGAPVSVDFVAQDGRMLGLGQWSADPCIHAIAADHAITEATAALASGGEDTAHVSVVVHAVARADQAISRLPADDRDRGALSARLLEVRAAALGVSNRALDASLGRLRAAERSADEVVILAAGREALMLCGAAPDRCAEVWNAVYGGAAAVANRPGRVATDRVRALLTGDEETAACLTAPAGCPAWLSHADAIAAFGPITAQSRAIHDRLSAASRAALVAFRAKLTEQSLDGLNLALAASAPEEAWCSTAWEDPTLREGCADLASAAAEGRAAIEGSQEEIVALRARIAAAERTALTQRWASAWRKRFDTCRKIDQMRAMLQNMGSCQGPCQAARRGAQADLDALLLIDGLLATPWADLDSESARTVAAECNTAHCPACPKVSSSGR